MDDTQSTKQGQGFAKGEHALLTVKIKQLINANQQYFCHINYSTIANVFLLKYHTILCAYM